MCLLFVFILILSEISEIYFYNNCRFSSKVASNVSSSQTIEIMELFTSELFCLPGLFEQGITTNKPSKRRKLDEKNTTNIKIIEPLSLLMCRFLKALRIVASFKDELEKEFQTIFDRFIYPILSCDYSDKDELLCKKLTYAALSLHHVMVDISIAYWKNATISHFVDILFSATLNDPKFVLFLVCFLLLLFDSKCDINFFFFLNNV
jgi:hypothetical protein